MLSLLFALTLLTPGVERPLAQAQAGVGQSFPRVAFGRSVGLVVWKEYDDTAQIGRLRAVRVTRDGVPLDEPLTLAQPFAALYADVAFDGDQFLIVWGQVGSTVGLRMNENGLITDRQPFVIGRSPYGGGLANAGCGDGRCLVVWSTGSQAAAAMVSPGGSVGPTFVIGSDSNPLAVISTSRPAFGRGRFAVAWSTFVNLGGPFPKPSGTALSFVDPGGTVLKQVWLREEEPGASASHAVAAWNGSEFAAFWEIEPAQLQWSFYGARFDASGATLQPPTLVSASGGRGLFDAGWIAGDWLLTASGSAPVAAYGMYVSPVLRRDLLFVLGNNVTVPAVSPDGTPLVVYSRAVAEGWRVFSRALDVPETAEPAKRRAVR